VGNVHDAGAAIDFVEGDIQKFDFDGAEVGVVRLRGAFYAFDGRCPHRGLSMRFGYVTDLYELVCPAHFAIFDLRSGLALDGPWDIEDIAVYNVRVEGGRVLVSVKSCGDVVEEETL
jgi:nitrite reductase/ring-hydroxylating ferredoxin subunit